MGRGDSPVSVWLRITQWLRPRGYPANLDWLGGTECITETPEMTEEEMEASAITFGDPRPPAE